MKEYIYFLKLIPRLKKGGWTEEDEFIVSRHFQHLLSLKEEEILVLAGRTQTSDDLTIGLVHFYADSLFEAKVIMESDPAIVEGIMVGEVFEFSTAIKGKSK